MRPSLAIRRRARDIAASAKNYPVRRRFGADFSGHVPLRDIGRPHPGGVDYIPSMWIGASRTLKRLALNERDVIADVGAGKGLVVLLAAEYGVRGVIGVEINSELAREAANHVERNRGGLKAQEVEIVCDDALEWEVPEDLSVVYMNNPFTGATFDRFVERLFGSLEAHPRGLRVVYAYPAEHERLMRTGRAQVLDVRPVTLLRRPGWWKSLEITVTYALGEGGLPAQRGARSAAVEYWGKRRG